jgi:hypothetical protein
MSVYSYAHPLDILPCRTSLSIPILYPHLKIFYSTPSTHKPRAIHSRLFYHEPWMPSSVSRWPNRRRERQCNYPAYRFKVLLNLLRRQLLAINIRESYKRVCTRYTWIFSSTALSLGKLSMKMGPASRSMFPGGIAATFNGLARI